MKKTQELNELREKNDTSLYREMIAEEKRLADLRFKASFRKLKNFKEIKKARKKIARLWTILAERTEQKLAEKESR